MSASVHELVAVVAATAMLQCACRTTGVAASDGAGPPHGAGDDRGAEVERGLALARGVHAESISEDEPLPGSPAMIARFMASVRQHQPAPVAGKPEAWGLLQEALAIYTATNDRVWEGVEGREKWAGAVPMAPLLPLEPAAQAAEDRVPRDLALVMLAELRQAGLFERLDALAPPAPLGLPAQDVRLVQWKFYELGRLRQIARYCTLRMQIAWLTGDEEDFMAAVQHRLTLARLAAQFPTVIARLVASGIEAVHSDIAVVFAWRPPSERVCRRLLELLDGQPDWPPFEYAMESEHIVALDGIDWLYGPGGLGDVPPIRERLAQLVGLEPVPELPHVPTREDDEQRLGQLLNVARAASGCPATKWKEMGIDRYSTGVPEDGIVAWLTEGALFGALRGEARRVCVRDGARLMMAVELHRARTGRYPENLGAIVPSELPAVPADPLTGVAWGYRVLPPTGDVPCGGYVLFSAGGEALLRGLPVSVRAADQPPQPHLDLIINRSSD